MSNETYTYINLRLRALELAIELGVGKYTQAGVMEAAEEFLAFLEGGVENEVIATAYMAGDRVFAAGEETRRTYEGTFVTHLDNEGLSLIRLDNGLSVVVIRDSIRMV